MLTILALTMLALAVVALVALSAKWLDFGLFGSVMFFQCCQAIFDTASHVAGAILSAATGNE